MNYSKLLIFSILTLGLYPLIGQSYDIKVKIKGYTNDTLLLGYYYGDKTYIKDTAFLNAGEYNFKGDTLLEGGMYLVVVKPAHDFIQILVDEQNQKFQIESEFQDLNGKVRFKGSKLNQEFYSYLDFLEGQRLQGDSLNKAFSQEADSMKKEQIRYKLDQIDKEVKSRQNKIFQNPNFSLIRLLLKLGTEPEIPEFEGTEEERKEKAFYHYRSHFFDDIDLNDDRIVRLPLFHGKIDRFLNKLTSQVPDSINESLDYILARTKSESQAYKYILSTQLTHFANSKYVGMDGVYVHLVEKYYGAGKAPWIDKEVQAKMIADAKTLKPLLIDKIAPDITVYKKDGTPVSLHSISAEYVVLFIWAPDCGHCKSSMPYVLKFYEEFKNKGVEILAVCSKIGEDEKTCWDAVESLKMGELLNTSDPQHRSKFRLVYDVKTTPQVYIMDKNKKILTKKIGAEQLSDVMKKIMELETN